MKMLRGGGGGWNFVFARGLFCTLVKRNRTIKWTSSQPGLLGSQNCDAAIPGGNFPSNHACGRPSEWTKRETGQWITHCSCPLLLRLMWSGPYCELYCHAVCTWKVWNLPLSWFLHERIRLNLINLRVLKIERGLHVKMLDSVPFTVRPWKKATCLRGHFAQYDFKKSPPFRKYAMKLCII